MNHRLKPLLIVACLLFSQLALAGVRTLPNGKVRDDSGKTSQTRLGVISALKAYPEGVFLLGYQIDAGGNNIPTAVLLDERLEEQGYWTFEAPINEVFRFRNEIYLFDYRGEVYRFADHQWSIVKEWQFGPWSVTYPLDDDVIVCHPAPLTKLESGTRSGGCRSLAHGWATELYWTEPKPKICGEELRVLVWLNEERVLQTLDLRDGRVVRSVVLPRKQAQARPLDLCRISRPRRP